MKSVCVIFAQFLPKFVTVGKFQYDVTTSVKFYQFLLAVVALLCAEKRTDSHYTP
jgi:hypothetical protein